MSKQPVEYMYPILAYLLGGIFLLSGFGKALDLVKFNEIVHQYRLGLPDMVAVFVPTLEIGLGLFLVSLSSVRQIARLSTMLLIILSVIYVYGWQFQAVENCGCFGTLNPVSLPPWLVLLRNLVLIGLALYLTRFPLAVTPPHKVLKSGLVYGGLGLYLFLLGMHFSKDPNQYNKDQHPFNNQLIEKTSLKDYVSTHPDSTYLLYMFSFNCEACARSVTNLNHYVEDGLVQKVIGVGLEHKTDIKLAFMSKNKPNFPIVIVKSAFFWGVTNKVPISFYVQKNRIVKTIIGQLAPSPLFKKSYLSQR